MKCFADPSEYTYYLPDEDREITLICDNEEEAEALLPTGLFAMLMAVNGDSRF